MRDDTFLVQVEKALNAAPGSIRLRDRLEDTAGWDSLGALSVIAVMDAHFGVTLDAGALIACETVRDLARLVTAERKAA